MIVDLNDAAAADEPLRCDVAIIGAGIAGSIMACELSTKGQRVVVLESGGLTQHDETHPLNRVVQTAQRYDGAERGRCRCLGGTSSRWGGALIPFQAGDLEDSRSTGSQAPWPIRLEELDPYVARAEAIFDLPPGTYDAPAAGLDAGTAQAEGSFRLRAAKWPSFRNRNVATIFEAQMRSPEGPMVWLNATLTAITLAENGRASRLCARSPAGSTLTLLPTEVLLAGGAIESTRLLLKLDADYDRRLSRSSDLIGRYFHDHLSAAVARIAVRDRKKLDRLTGFRFQGSGMRNVRFEVDGARGRNQGLPGAFVHIAFSASAPNGFDGLRGIYRALQRGGLPESRDVSLLARNAGWLARAAWKRFVERRVLPPDDVEYETHVVTEQVPVASNRITLSDRERDAFGVPLAEIEWRVSPRDIDNSQAVLDAFVKYWCAMPLAELGTLEVYDRSRWSAALAEGGGIYHPGGSLRMAASSAEGVVDKDLRVFGVPNLRVVSTATFPSGGSANPTMMLILFALRAADQIAAASAA